MIKKINLWKQHPRLWLGTQSCAEDSGVVWMWLLDTVKPGLCGCLCTWHAKVRKRATSVFLRCYPACVLRQVLWLAWLDGAGLLASPDTGIISASHHSWLFYMGSRDQMHVLILHFKHLINGAILLSLSVFFFSVTSLESLAPVRKSPMWAFPPLTLYLSLLANPSPHPCIYVPQTFPQAGVHNLLIVPHTATLLELIIQDL